MNPESVPNGPPKGTPRDRQGTAKGAPRGAPRGAPWERQGSAKGAPRARAGPKSTKLKLQNQEKTTTKTLKRCLFVSSASPDKLRSRPRGSAKGSAKGAPRERQGSAKGSARGAPRERQGSAKGAPRAPKDTQWNPDRFPADSRKTARRTPETPKGPHWSTGSWGGAWDVAWIPQRSPPLRSPLAQLPTFPKHTLRRTVSCQSWARDRYPRPRLAKRVSNR